MTEDSVTAYPIAGWAVYTLPQASAIVRFDLVPNKQALKTGERIHVPVAMTAAQMLELAALLLKTAGATEMGQSPSGMRN